jgi:hypothetical protein
LLSRAKRIASPANRSKKGRDQGLISPKPASKCHAQSAK